MARSKLILNIGTITEEECLTEELTEEDSISAVELPDVTFRENGTGNYGPSEQVDNANGKEDAGDDDSGGDDGEDPDDDTGSFVELDRPSSLVEKEDVEDNISILTLMLRARTQAALCPSSSSSSHLASSGKPKNLGTAAGGDKTRSRNSMRNSTRSLPGKYITELSLYNPAHGPSLADAFSLGIFLATDGAIGDHIIYKINPGSPLDALNIKQQDRLQKINDLDVRDWSHSCLLEFIRSLSLSGDKTPDDTEVHETKAFYEVPFALEFRRPGRVTLTPNSCPVTTRVTAKLKISSTAREKVMLTLLGSPSSSRLRHVGILTRRLKARGIPEESSHLRALSTASTTTLSFGPKDEVPYSECFRVHLFEREGVPSVGGSPEGLLTMLEAPENKGFLYARDHNSVHIVTTQLETTGDVAMADPRVFWMRQEQQHHTGKSVVYFTNVATGHCLSASGSIVTLTSKRLDEGCSPDLLFDLISCQQHKEHADASS
ncbi:uncharacterized protein LOC143024775 [Oratosquilla oratoria]|uniref:uncharacterized protein LOC143024775 n=1 Tax=Oratosquilla oratoria TaxID=337810 RepID=UPI003F758B7A